MRVRNGTNRANVKLVMRRLSILVLRFFLAVVLLTSSAPASTVLCVGPTGHNAIEEWAARCCASGTRTSDVAFHDVPPCHGCTDYVIAAAVDIRSVQSDSSSTLTDEHLAFFTEALPQQAAIAALPHLIDSEVHRVPNNSIPASVSLRC
jgi:hypothetical protein